MRPGRAKGAGLRPRAKALETPPDPTAPFGSALCGNVGRDRAEISRGRSSRSGQEARAVKGRTREHKEEP
jgi:hypothetical protein